MVPPSLLWPCLHRWWRCPRNPFLQMLVCEHITSEIGKFLQWNDVVFSWSTSTDALCNALCHFQGNCWSGKHGKHNIALLCQSLWTFCHLHPEHHDYNKTQRKARRMD